MRGALAGGALARDAAAVVALLERFGGLLAEALDAAGRGADDEFAVALAERGRVVVAIGNRLAALAVTCEVARRDGAAAAEIARVLEPVDHALRHAQLLHDRVDDGPAGAGAEDRALAGGSGHRRRGLALVE